MLITNIIFLPSTCCSLPTDAQQHCSREEQYNHLPTSHRPDITIAESGGKEDVIDDMQRVIYEVEVDGVGEWKISFEATKHSKKLMKIRII
jgi:hypothetical protein